MSEQQEWRIGELARATKVTVRALHHYDRLGLLVPSSRTAGGHRCYTGDDVRRLHTILALRGFGLSLRDIAAALAAGGEEPREILRRQLAETEERIRQAKQVRVSLLGLLARLEKPGMDPASEAGREKPSDGRREKASVAGRDPASEAGNVPASEAGREQVKEAAGEPAGKPETSQFVTLIEEMMTMSQPLTPEQIEQMNKDRREAVSRLTEEELAEMNRRRSDARAAMSPEQLAEMENNRARLMGTTPS